MSEPKPNIAGVVLLVSISLGLVVGANFWKKSLRVRNVEVYGNHLVQKNEVLQLANVRSGVTLSSVDLSDIQRNVMSHHYVRDAWVERDLPATLRITVAERVPAAIVYRNEISYLDQDGVVLPRTVARAVLDLPVISGIPDTMSLALGSQVRWENVSEALDVIRGLKALNRELYHNVSEVQVGGGEIVLVAAEEGVPILFGRGEVATKLVLFEAFWNNVVHTRGPRALRLVDLRFEGQVVARWDDSGKNIAHRVD